MGPGWVAGAVRGRALAGRRLGAEGVTMLGDARDLGAASAYLARTSYGPRPGPGASLVEARRAVGDAALWNLRVLAGWLPPMGGEVVRVVAGWFEVQNLIQHALRLGSVSLGEPPYELGALEVVWDSARPTRTLDDLAGVLRTRGWGDPRDADLESVLHAIVAGWGRRLADGPTNRPRWGEALIAIEVAKSLLVDPARPLGWHDRLVPSDVEGIGAVAELASVLPREASWVLDGIQDLREAEPKWWDVVGREAEAGLTGRSMDRAAVVCAGMALVVDAHRVQGLLGAAWRRGGAGEGHAVA